MLKNQSNLKQQEKTKTLLREALIFLLKSKEITKITVQEICLEAGLSRGTFYTYYTSAEELLREMEDDVLEAIFDTLRSMHDPVTYFSKTHAVKTAEINAYLRYCVSIKDRLMVFFSDNCGIYFSHKLSQFYKTTFHSIIPHPNTAAKIKIDFLIGGILNAIKEFSLHETNFTTENLSIISKTICALTEAQFMLLQHEL